MFALRAYKTRQDRKVRYGYADAKAHSYIDPSDCDVCDTRGPAISMAFDDKTEYHDAKTSLHDPRVTFADEKVGYHDPRVTLADEKVGYRDAKRGYQDAKVAFADEKTGYRDARVALAEEKTGYRDAKVAFADEKVKYHNARVAFADEKVAFADEKIAFADEKVRYHDEDDEKTEYHEEIIEYADAPSFKTTLKVDRPAVDRPVDALPTISPRPSMERLNRSRTIRRHHTTEKANFLRKYGFAYGYDGRIDEIRRVEYPHLKGNTYLDHSGATIYPQSLIREFADDLANNCYGNPHSMSPSSLLATKRVEEVRRQVLAHFQADPEDYSVVFTQNCTAALKLVGEIFPWTQGKSRFWFLGEAHMSLLGLRRIAEAAGARSIQPMNEQEVEDVIRESKKGSNLRKLVGQSSYDLFAYPAQCNFSGLRFPLSWPARIKAARNSKSSKTLVLLDAAAYIMTSPLSLADKDSSPDFTVMSFYKIFGFPTGLGALIVKNELMPVLRKRYFGGGTVLQVQPRALWETFRETISERFEDGTINFLSIIALGHAFKTIERLYGDFVRVRAHAATLAYFAHSRMASMQHSNGRPVCIIYSDRDFSNPTTQGPVIAFNFLDPTGRTVPYPSVEKFAGEGKIHVRAGSHCNPGAVLRWLHLTKEDFARRDCEATDGTVNGKTSGVVRISFGAMTTIDDVLAWLDFARSMFTR